MTNAKSCCRERLENICDEERPDEEHPCSGDHAGLLRDKYLKVADNVDARKDLHKAVCNAPNRSFEMYKIAFKRYCDSLPGPKAEGIFKTNGRLVIGLGAENVLETGLTLHHTYGVPILPGSALKGLAAHYCHNVWSRANGIESQGFCKDGDYYKAIFGNTEDAGHMIFHDGWITPSSLRESLKLDVMTPHHGDYYSGKDPKAAPTDFDNPNPVTFLSIVGSFHIAVSCDVLGEVGKKWVDLTLQLLSEALQHWGIGGKTNAGYGRLTMGDPVQDEEGHPKPVPRHKKGETLEVTRSEDPKGKGRPYFLADDGFGGFVKNNPPNISMGEEIKLEVAGVMAEGYDFAILGSKEKHPKTKKGKKRWRR